MARSLYGWLGAFELASYYWCYLPFPTSPYIKGKTFGGEPCSRRSLVLGSYSKSGTLNNRGDRELAGKMVVLDRNVLIS